MLLLKKRLIWLLYLLSSPLLPSPLISAPLSFSSILSLSHFLYPSFPLPFAPSFSLLFSLLFFIPILPSLFPFSLFLCFLPSPKTLFYCHGFVCLNFSAEKMSSPYKFPNLTHLVIVLQLVIR